jgi:hypothetical protein
MAKVEDQYPGVLRNIELAIIGVYRADRALLDAHVADALDGLMRVYQAEARGRGGPNLRLSPPAQAVFAAAKSMCDWHLGRETVVNAEGVAQDPGPALSVEEIMPCLKRLRRSVEHWTRQNGRQGYLSYVDGFL